MKHEQLNNKLKRKALENMGEKPAQIIHKELTNLDLETITSHDKHLIRRNIYRARSLIIKKSSKSAQSSGF